MNAVPKLLAKEVEVRLEKPIASLSAMASGWLARTKDGLTARVVLPRGLAGNFVWRGLNTALKPGEQTLHLP